MPLSLYSTSLQAYSYPSDLSVCFSQTGSFKNYTVTHLETLNLLDMLPEAKLFHVLN